MKNLFIACFLALSTIGFADEAKQTSISHHDLMLDRYSQLVQSDAGCIDIYHRFAEHLSREGFKQDELDRIYHAIFFVTYQNQQTPAAVFNALSCADHLLSVGKVKDADLLVAAVLQEVALEDVQKYFGDKVHGYVAASKQETSTVH